MSFYNSESSYPNTYSLAPLKYQKPGCQSDNASMCMMIAVAAIVFYITSIPTARRHPMYRGGVEALSSMAAVVESAVTTVKDTIVGDSPVSLTVDASTVYKDLVEGVSLIDVPKANTNAMAFQTASDEEKEDVHDKLVQWLQVHPRAMIMIFAPWCRHCHNAMPTFVERAKVIKASGIDSLMINAEALPRSTFMGDKALLQCEYFPTFVAKTVDLEVKSTIEAAAEAVIEAAAEEKTKEDPPDVEIVEEKEEDTSMMLDKLF